MAASNPHDGRSQLMINLQALAENYQHLLGKSGAKAAAPVIKANGYGLGSDVAALTLFNAGARGFFVAHLDEAVTVRNALNEAMPEYKSHVPIYVLNGFFAPEFKLYSQYRISPVLNTLEQLNQWQALPFQHIAHGAALHIDTGMNRLGLRCEQAEQAAQNQKGLTLIMSHLACGDEPDHPLNALQLERFNSVRALFPKLSASLANTAGCLLGQDYGFDLARPGIGLYGSNPFCNSAKPQLGAGLKPVVTLNARILQLRHVPQGESVGYGASFVATCDSRIATLACGYADGFLRASQASHAAFEGQIYPFAGRISMDLLAVDVTNAPAQIQEGDVMELFGHTISIDEVALKAGTIAYELLTDLGRRYTRIPLDN